MPTWPRDLQQAGSSERITPSDLAGITHTPCLPGAARVSGHWLVIAAGSQDSFAR